MGETKTFPELTVEEAAELIAQGAAVIVDVNPRPRWSSGHLPGALNLDAGSFAEADIPAPRTPISSSTARTMTARPAVTQRSGRRKWASSMCSPCRRGSKAGWPPATAPWRDDKRAGAIRS
ncbi:MAG: rhodanese-like domain-containing protein [Rhodomicrobium sp.]|nr:rhodanese-like domain-containing protein [Rhodomicrobium sp.]